MINMLDGITILNTYEVVSKTQFSWSGFWIGVLISLVFSIIAGLIQTDDLCDFLLFTVILGVVIGGIVGLFFGFAVMPKPIEYKPEYEVTISDEVSMNDFHNRYDVIEQRGDIYVIREKEQEG